MNEKYIRHNNGLAFMFEYLSQTDPEPSKSRNSGRGFPLIDENVVTNSGREVLGLGADERAHR